MSDEALKDGKIHKKCAETVIDAMSGGRDPGPTILMVQALCRKSGGLPKAQRVEEPSQPTASKSRKKSAGDNAEREGAKAPA